MAVTLELNSGAIAADLDLNAAVGAGIRMESWSQAVASPVYGGQPGPVKETMVLMVERTTHNLLAASIQALDEYRVQADAYMRDRNTEDPVWLECKMDDETGTRRSMVKNISESYRLPLYSGLCGPNQDTTRIKLELVRMPWWEDTTATDITLINVGAGAAVAVDYTVGGDIVGDVPARQSWMLVEPALNTQTMFRLWIGLRSANKHPAIANFEPIWECEDGTNNAAESGIVDDAAAAVNSASPGGGSGVFVELTETDLNWDDEWHEVLELKLEDAVTTAGYEDDNYGRYLWILRYGVAAGTDWDVQLRWGYSDMADVDFVRGPIVSLDPDAAAWDVAACGTMAIPLRNLHVFDTSIYNSQYDQAYAVQIWARRTGGAGTLRLDCLLLVPVDEGYMFSDNFRTIRTDATTISRWVAGEGVSGETSAVTWLLDEDAAPDDYLIQRLPAITHNNFRLPIGDGRYIIVYARDKGVAGSDLLDQINVDAQYYERWSSLRGAE